MQWVINLCKTGVGRTVTSKDVSTSTTSGQKRRYAVPASVRRVLPVFEKEADPRFSKVASGFSYTGEVLFTFFSALILVELFVKNPVALASIHSVRFLAMLTIFLMNAYSIYRGTSVPEVDIRFYFVELLVVLAVNIAAIVVQLARFKSAPRSIGTFLGLLIPAGFTLFNFYLLAQQVYRFRLGKRTTPINTVFTMLMAVMLAVMSGRAIYTNLNLLK